MRSARPALITAAIVSLAASLHSQTFSSAPGTPWKQVVIPCTAAPTVDLTKGTTFTATLCATPMNIAFTNVSRVNGKVLNFIVCQDSNGSRIFHYPNVVLGVAPISPSAGNCTAQSFAVASGQVFAVSTGQQQSLIPAPNLLNPPWDTMTYQPGNGNLTVVNETTGILATMSGPLDTTLRETQAYAHTNSGAGTITGTAIFYIVQPDLSAENFYGFAMTEHQNGEFCGLFVSTASGIIVAYKSTAGQPRTWGTSAPIGTNFDSPTRQLVLRYAQNLDTHTATCAYSADGGATYNQLGTRDADYYGMYSNPYIGLGGAWGKPAGAQMHITSLSLVQQ